MAQATTNAAIEAELHAAITKEARRNKISFSEQVARYRTLARAKVDADLKEATRLNQEQGVN